MFDGKVSLIFLVLLHGMCSGRGPRNRQIKTRS